MFLRHYVVGTYSVGMLILGAGAVCGQNFPSKPIRIVTAEAGGGSDFVTRLIAQNLTGSLGQQVIVDNRPSAGGIVAAQSVSKAPPDGYTLLSYGSTIWIAPLMQDLPYDPVEDFAPVSLTVISPIILVVHPSLRVKSVKELIALAKARPGELNYASAGSGAPTHIAAEIFRALAGVKIVRINYKGSGSARNAIIGGEVQVMFPTAGGVGSHVKSGRLRALAVTSAKPSELFPDLPTIAATVPGYESVSTYGVFAPAKTPIATVNRLSAEIVRVLKRAEVKEMFANAGLEVIASTPQEFAVGMKAEMTTSGKVIKDAGIRAE